MEARDRKDKITKPPYQAQHPNQRASSTNPQTWSDFNTALSAYQTGKADGLGFCLFKSSIAAFDLDDCRNATTGKLELQHANSSSAPRAMSK